jgi:hypothetical protein
MKRKLIFTLALLAIVYQTHAQQRKPIYTALEINYLALQTADAITTHQALKLGGTEVNPAARWMIDNRILIPGKIVTSGVFLYSCRRIHRDNPKLATAYLIAGNLVYGAVVYNNYQVCLKLKI